MLWAWFSWWNKLFPLLPVRFSWPATISGGWKGLVYCRPIPIFFSFFKPTKELINLFAFVFEIQPLLKQIQHTNTLHPSPLFITHQKYSTPPHIVWSSLVLAPISTYKFSRLISLHFLKKKLVERIWEKIKDWSLCNQFISSPRLCSWQSIDIVRRKIMLSPLRLKG